ncbi:pectate lyase superfamily protein-domain-containing protein [Triangularia verruculosa]|uniref:Pectate lyase superfamily protein-domain-containing protein n=1 Tax=Triangularia verruculosa TaxID=2587418 RepID=A0AAN7AXA3_9PEZI|nr:pectate lyase superfamily protein-domain-containing protein [Triangularia verruculosa]
MLCSTPKFLCILAATILPWQPHNTYVQAQFVQGVTTIAIPSPTVPNQVTRVPVWRETLQHQYQRVIDIAPELVVLEYNCYYMRDICKNADNWMQTVRGSTRVPRNRFAYDFNTGNHRFRNTKRRTASCGNFKNRVTCPHTDQNIVMRHDGPWRYKDLEPGTTINEIRSDQTSGQRIPSQVRYTCDEFPPATWIEGGNGSPAPEAYPMVGETRCAAFRCDRTRGVKAEQNWQATAHNALQSSLKAVINRRNRAATPQEFDWYRAKDSIVFFEFRYDIVRNFADGVAARVFTYTTRGQNPPAVEKKISQAKRDLLSVNATAEGMSSAELDREAFWRWADEVSIDELLALGPSHVSEQHILANHSEAEVPIPGFGMPWMEFGQFEDPDGLSPLPDMVSGPPRADPNKLKRQAFTEATANVSTSGGISDTPLLRNVSTTDLERARKIVEEAILKSAELNAARLQNPARNVYRLKPGTVLGGGAPQRRGLMSRADEAGEELPPPLLDITDEIAAAAALVSEAEAVEALGGMSNLTARHSRRQVKAAASGTFWMEHITRMGTVPFGDDPSYKVFRNVLDYGAKGDGVTDDTKAIKLAMNDGKRCGEKCNGSTVKNAIVYFPPGTYRVSSTIPMPFGTQVIGDANNWPTLLATRNFIGLGVLSANEYTGGGKGTDGLDQQWYVNTANFYRQIRNIKIDITQTRPVQEVAGLHYQIAQATSLQNVEIIATSGSTQRGIFAENGSGGVISDVTFRGGKFGLFGGEQQFTAQRLTFIGCDTGVQVIWDWGWVWKSITMTDVGVGFRLLQDDKKATKRQTVQGNNATGNIGSASFIDSTFRNVKTVVLIAPPNKTPGSGSTGVIVENVACQGVSQVVADTSGATLLSPPASGVVEHWALGPVYKESKPEFSMGGKIGTFRRQQGLLDPQGAYFERAKPQYEGRPVGDFVHVKDFGARGDGVTDDTAAFQRALYESQGRILFVDAGSYIITGTITIPTGSKIVGETWSQLVASGPYFQNAQEPKVMIQVGTEGSVGDVEMQDLLFTNRGPTAGLILIEWNIRAASPGSAALWDCHVRIGGALGTDLTPAECPALRSGVAQGCNAASLMMHITPRASGYFENMWLWVADHMIDDPDMVDANNTMVQNSVYVARGLLVESTSPTWLYGTSSEHAVFYQYNFHKAQNIFAGMIQTESPYFQPTPNPPAPFEAAVGKLPGDPDYSCKSGDEFSGCDQSWAVIIRESANIFVAGAGLYSWFSTYAQDCIDQHACQNALMLLKDNHAGVRFQHLITIGAKYMAVMNGKGILALDYLNVESHPRWSQISVLDVSSDGEMAQMLWIDPKIWDMAQPEFTCKPPCLVNIPPWTKATRIVEYPRLTITDGNWATTITAPPLTISTLLFKPVTLTAASPGRRHKRDAQPFGDFFPTPATTPSWPSVTYTNQDGVILETAPTVPFPPPPATIGPNLPPPVAGGSWPRLAIRAVAGDFEQPLVPECFWNDFTNMYDCDIPWDNLPGFGWPEYGEMPDAPGGDLDDGDYGEADTICPERATSTTTTTKTTATTKEPDKPTESPLEEGRPMDNIRHCYDKGQKANNAQMANTARSFCRGLGNEGSVIRNPVGSGRNVVVARNFDLPANGGWAINIDAELLVKPGCEFIVNYSQCERYMKGPIDSCNCEGADGKQGGHLENRCYRWRLDPQTF